MSAVFKWLLVAYFGLAVVAAIADAGKHGQPKGTYNARTEAIVAVVALLLAVAVAWLWP